MITETIIELGRVVISWLPFTFKLINDGVKWLIHELIGRNLNLINKIFFLIFYVKTIVTHLFHLFKYIFKNAKNQQYITYLTALLFSNSRNQHSDILMIV